jgi:hypothetical protein
MTQRRVLEVTTPVRATVHQTLKQQERDSSVEAENSAVCYTVLQLHACAVRVRGRVRQNEAREKIQKTSVGVADTTHHTAA